MKRFIIATLVLFYMFAVKGQGIYDTSMMQKYVKAYGQMTQRAIEIMHAVQPYREKQYELYRNGRYQDVIDICLDVRKNYTYYAFDDKAISDMECLAGDAAIKLRQYEMALSLYQIAVSAEDSNANRKMFGLFNTLVNEAAENAKANNYYNMWQVLALASRTGYENGKYFYYLGEYYEHTSDISSAKKYYKKAKKKDFPLADSALRRLKSKKKY